MLLPGEGEGRNAVYAAKHGWLVEAFDQSTNAQIKALNLAKKNNVNINYSVIDLKKLTPAENYYNAAAIIFVHFNSHFKCDERGEVKEMSINNENKQVSDLHNNN